MAEFKIQAYVANLERYNEGALEGEWISFPTTPREMERLLSRIGVESAENMSIPNDAFFIANFATDLPGDIDRISQFDSLEKLNYLAGRLEEMDDRDFARFTQALHQRIELPESGIDGLINLTFNLNQIWLQPEAVRVNGFSLRPMLPEERLYAYGQSSQLAMQTGSIGRLRGDMDWSGDGFFTSWEDTNAGLKTDAFKEEFNRLIGNLRENESFGKMLQSRRAIANYGMEHPESAFSDRYDTEFGFRADSEKYSYFLRLNARQGDYNVYIFCYDRPLLEEHMTQAKEGIRFITPEYEELFRIPDGGKIRINWKDGKTKVDTVCRYIDDYHMATSSRLYHISEFAEIARQKGAVVEPLTPVLDREKKIPWNRVFDGSVDKIPGKYRLPALASEAFQERVKQAMRAAGYEFDRIESDYGCLRFDGESTRMSFGSWKEAARWLEEALIDDPALCGRVCRILHPEEAEKIKVLVVEPKKEPYVKEISPGLESLQREVGGYIEAVYPFGDPVALICNEEGKLDGLPLNRALYNERGTLRDVISGTMLVVGLTEDNFGALSPELLEKYAEVYREPETFITINGAYYAYPIVEAGKEEADRIAADTISLYARNGADIYNRSSPEKVQQAVDAVSVVVRSGDDYPLRSTLLDIAENEPEDARVALNLIKDLDRFYLEQGTPRYELYQIGNDDEDVFRNYGYRSLEEIRKEGLSVDGRNYACVYSGRLKPEDTLDSLYERFNLRKPFDFYGHSLSVSDVIVTGRDGTQQAWYVDSFGFQEVPEFFEHNPLEKVEELLEDDYGMIDGIINNGDRMKDEREKPSVLGKLQEKHQEAAEHNRDRAKPEKTKSQEKDLS